MAEKHGFLGIEVGNKLKTGCCMIFTGDAGLRGDIIIYMNKLLCAH